MTRLIDTKIIIHKDLNADQIDNLMSKISELLQEETKGWYELKWEAYQIKERNK